MLGAAVQVSKEMQPAVSALRTLVQECAAALASAPGKKREIEDNSKRIGALFWRLNAGDVSPEVQAKLLEIAAALSAADYGAVHAIQVWARLKCWCGFKSMSRSPGGACSEGNLCDKKRRSVCSVCDLVLLSCFVAAHGRACLCMLFHHYCHALCLSSCHSLECTRQLHGLSLLVDLCSVS